MKKIHRFIGQFELDAERALIRDVGLVHQMRTVLKLHVGEKIILSDGRGREAVFKILAVASSGIEVAFLERRVSLEPKKTVVLYCALLKRENFEYAVGKAVECGVNMIVPLITARTVKLGLNIDRLQKIAQEAAEQSGRGIVPEVAMPVKFSMALKVAGEHGANYFFDVDGEEFIRVKSLVKTVGVWIGPEGGWEDFELKAAKECGLSIASLGGLVLRAETAVTVAVYLASR